MCKEMFLFVLAMGGYFFSMKCFPFLYPNLPAINHDHNPYSSYHTSEDLDVPLTTIYSPVYESLYPGMKDMTLFLRMYKPG